MHDWKALAHESNRLANAGCLDGAVAASEQALIAAEASMAPDDPMLTGLQNNLAVFYSMQGEYVKAERLLLKSLTDWEDHFGADCPDLASIMQSLGTLYLKLGRLDEVESLYRRALEIREQAYGTDHPEVGESLNCLALFLKETGRFQEAQGLELRASYISGGL